MRSLARTLDRFITGTIPPTITRAITRVIIRIIGRALIAPARRLPVVLAAGSCALMMLLLCIVVLGTQSGWAQLIPASDPAPGATASPWSSPLKPQPKVLRVFDPPDRPWLAGHRGVDFPVGTAEPVYAPASGRVSFRGFVVDREVVVLDHGSGLRSSFEPVGSELQPGDQVSQGQKIGEVSGSGGHCGESSCMHWGVRLGEEYVNPLTFLGDRRPSVLLPWNEEAPP